VRLTITPIGAKPNAEPDLEHRITTALERGKERTAFELDPVALDRPVPRIDSGRPATSRRLRDSDFQR
jgi:hypothetical protein